jgi:hypothetical protein
VEITRLLKLHFEIWRQLVNGKRHRLNYSRQNANISQIFDTVWGMTQEKQSPKMFKNLKPWVRSDMSMPEIGTALLAQSRLTKKAVKYQ